MSAVTLVQARSAEEIAAARALFQEYGASLGFSLCFQSFDQELAQLPGNYAPPEGRLLLALDPSENGSAKYAGCVALHPLAETICEMKRLYLRPSFRGKGLGRSLAVTVISEARRIGYTRMRLDTVEPIMRDAVAMYRRLGFKEITPCRPNPIAGAMYMELEL